MTSEALNKVLVIRETGQVTETVPEGGSVLRRSCFAKLFFTPSKLDALLYLPQLCPLISQLPDPVSYNAKPSDIFWGRILQGEPCSKKHFESLLNVVSREKR